MDWLIGWVQFLVGWLVGGFKFSIDWLIGGVKFLIDWSIGLIQLLVCTIYSKISYAVLFMSHHVFLLCLGIYLIVRICPGARAACKRFTTFIGRILMKSLGLDMMEDSVCLTSGSQELRIDLNGRTPINVWVSFGDQEGMPVCQGSVDKVGVQLGDTFFVLYADIYSASRVVRWLVVSN